MRVAVLGCGYVGLELGRRLVAAGHEAIGVRRSDDGLAAVEDAGLDDVRADVTDASTLAAVPDVDALVFAASPDDRSADASRAVRVGGLRTVVDHFAARASPPDRLVYTSSTGVYGDHGGDWVDETTPVEPTDDRGPTPVDDRRRALVEAEGVVRERATDEGIDGTVVRLGGLYGPGRYRLERYLEGPVTEGYRNLLHRDDAAGVIRFLLETEPTTDLVVAVDDEPVSRWAFADWLAEECGVPAPPRRTLEERLADPDLDEARRRRLTANKRCSNERLRSLGYEFEYPTYRTGFRDAVSRYCHAEDDG